MVTSKNSAVAKVERQLAKHLPNANVKAISTKTEAESFWDLLGVFHSNPPARGTKEMLVNYSTMPWLRAVCDKISSSTATTVWRAFVKTKEGEKKGSRIPVRAPQLQQMRFDERKAEIQRLKAVGDLQEIEEHPLIDAMYATGATFTGYTNRELLQKWLDLVGEAFWIKVRNEARMPTSFIPVPPHWVTNTPNNEKDYFELQPPNGKIEPIKTKDMIWFYHPNPHDPYGRGSGMGVTLADELETDEYAAKFMKTFFYNSARPDVLISSGNLKKEDTDRLEKRWVDKLRGWRRSFLPFFMNREIEVHQLGTDYGHLSMLELRKNQRDAVIQVYGVPPETLGIVEASNRATAEIAEYLYARWVLIPRLEFQRQILQFHLVPEYDERIILDYDSPVAQDKEHNLKIATAAPWSLYLDEWREMQGKLPLPEGKGQVFMKPLNYEAVLLEDLGEPYSQQNGNGESDDQDPSGDPAVEPPEEEPEDEMEESANRVWPELITNMVSRQRVAPRIGTRKEQIQTALGAAFAEIADDARGRAADIQDILTVGDDGADVAIASIMNVGPCDAAMYPVVSKLTAVYVLAAEQAKAQLAMFVTDEKDIEVLEPINALKAARDSVEREIVRAISGALYAIGDAAEHESPESLTFLLIDGVGIGASDAQEFVANDGEGDEVVPLFENFAEQMADHAITHMVNRAQEALWSEAARKGILNPNKVSRLWITRLGCRSCTECSDMDGKTNPIDLAWKLPEGGTVVTPTEAHSECHCTERLVRKEA